MPLWASSVVPEGALVRRIQRSDSAAAAAFRQELALAGTPSRRRQQQKRERRRIALSDLEHQQQQVPFDGADAADSGGGDVDSSDEQQPLSQFAQYVAARERQQQQQQPSNANEGGASMQPPQRSHQHHHHHHAQPQSTRHHLGNPQYSTDPVTRNVQTRALAASGTFGARAQVIPQHVRTVVTTLRRNVDEMKRFAAEVPVLTSSEIPSATKRLAALLYAQTIAVDDLCRFTEDELRFSSSCVYDLVGQLAEAQAAPYIPVLRPRPASPVAAGSATTTTTATSTANSSSPVSPVVPAEQPTVAAPAAAAMINEPPPLASRIADTLRELNSFRALYTMLAAIANVTGAAEARLFLYPSAELLAADAASSDNGDGGAVSGASRLSAAAGPPTPDPRKLHLIAQVQAQPFGPRRSATAPTDIVRIAEAVAQSRCAANLTPGIARVRASFTSLIAVPLFVPTQPESAVLGVVVLTNKRATTQNSTITTGNQALRPQQQQQQASTTLTGDGQLDDTTMVAAEFTSRTLESTLAQLGKTSHFDNSAGSATWVTRGFYGDDEHKAVIAAEMMAWLLHKLPLGVLLRGAVRLSPAGFAAEWAGWAAGGASSATTAAAAASGGEQQQQHDGTGSIAAVLDARLAMLQVPRRRFVFRTEDPREVAAAGALKLAAANNKTRAVIAPESGDYLLNVAQSHRALEERNDALERRASALEADVARLAAELDQERQQRRHAEAAAHGMQVACDRIVRKSIAQQTQAALLQQQLQELQAQLLAQQHQLREQQQQQQLREQQQQQQRQQRTHSPAHTAAEAQRQRSRDGAKGRGSPSSPLSPSLAAEAIVAPHHQLPAGHAPSPSSPALGGAAAPRRTASPPVVVVVASSSPTGARQSSPNSSRSGSATPMRASTANAAAVTAFENDVRAYAEAAAPYTSASIGVKARPTPPPLAVAALSLTSRPGSRESARATPPPPLPHSVNSTSGAHRGGSGSIPALAPTPASAAAAASLATALGFPSHPLPLPSTAQQQQLLSAQQIAAAAAAPLGATASSRAIPRFHAPAPAPHPPPPSSANRSKRR